MATLSERLNSPISTAELERRWAAVRAAMAEQGIDALVMQNNNDHMGGYVKYFTDMPAINGYPVEVVFPADDDMTVVCQGPFGAERDLDHGGDGVWRGVKKLLHTPSYASAHYTASYDPELAARGLAPFARGTIGIVGSFQMGAAMLDHLRAGPLSGARFVDATELVDRIKVIKSAEEIALIEATAKLQDGAMRAAFGAIEPGMRDSDVAAVAKLYSEQQGSEQGIYLCASAPVGTPCMFGPRHLQNRIIEEGDQFALLVENNGPGGFFTELGRTCVLGTAPQELKDETEFVRQARQFTLDLLSPGAAPKEIWDSYNAFMRDNGRPEEKRLYCHGQGYDMVERPLVRNDEPMPIAAKMNIVVHPTYIRGSVMAWLCDNYIIGDNGPGARLHAFPEIVTEL